jgi:hypothetical protein
MLRMVSYSRRPQSGHIVCYLNRTYHVLTTGEDASLGRAADFCYAFGALPPWEFQITLKLPNTTVKENAMLRFMIRPSCLIAALLVASFALAQTEFSADMVDTRKPGTPSVGKVYLARDKMRFESAAGKSSAAVIVNLDTQTSTVLMDKQRMYMEMPTQSGQQRTMYNFFRTGDVESACADWAQQARNKGGSCHKIGSETVNGRATVKYEGTTASGETTTFWLDPKLRFAVRWDSKNGAGELRNIQEGSQPASLFEIPAGYTKFDMAGMMKQQPQ